MVALVDLISDIVSGVLFLAFLIFSLIVIFRCSKYRELEFNRIWRTRIYITILALLFEACMCLSNLHIFSNALKSHQDIYCSIPTYIQSSIIFPLFIFTIYMLVKVATTVTLLEDSNPNKTVTSKSSLYSLFPFIIGVVPLAVNICKKQIPAFTSFNTDDNYCQVSTVSAGIEAFVMLISMILLFKTNDAFNKTSLNSVHKNRIKVFPLIGILFLCQEAAEIVASFVKGTVFIVLKLGAAILSFTGFVMFIYLLVIRPISEALIDPLYRGSLTKRHGKMRKENPPSGVVSV